MYVHNWVIFSCKIRNWLILFLLNQVFSNYPHIGLTARQLLMICSIFTIFLTIETVFSKSSKVWKYFFM